MSLATSCPACSTTFRVAEEQLQASEGWVRCGQCHQIFDALERLFDLDHPPPPAVGPIAAIAGEDAADTQLISPPAATESHGDHADDQGDDTPGWAETCPALFGDESVLLQPSQSSQVEASATAETPSDALLMHDGATLHLLADLGHAVPAQDAAARPSLPTDIENDTASATVFLVESGMEEEDGADKQAGHKLIQELEPSVTIQPQPSQAAAMGAPSTAVETAGSPGSPLKKQTPRVAAEDAGSSPPTATAPQAPRRTRGSTKAGIKGHTASNPSEASSQALSPSSSTPADVEAQASGLPAFVRKADQDARWRRPWIRLSLSLIGLLALVVLIGQIGYHWRNLIAARAPVLRPSLVLGCEWLGCQLTPAHVLEAVVVENTSLTRPPGIPEGYRLSIALRNKAEHDIAAPSMELTLTDTSNAVLSRRVLHPVDFGVSQPTLSAQADAAWQLIFLSPETRITGYTVRAFYP